jgi:hypothetical protein
MPTVVQHKVGPARTVDMEIELGQGVALVTLEGDIAIPCWCKQVHEYSLRLVLKIKPEAKHRDHEDLERALRGDDEAAQALAWRLMVLASFNQPHPEG